MLHLLRHSSEGVAALNFRFRLPFSSASECVALIRSNAVQVVRFRDHWIDYVDREARGWVPHRPSVRPTATIRTTRERTSAACTGGFRIDLLIGRWLDGRLPDGSGPILFFSTPAHPRCYLSMLLQTGDFINCAAGKLPTSLHLETSLRPGENVELTNNSSATAFNLFTNSWGSGVNFIK